MDGDATEQATSEHRMSPQAFRALGYLQELNRRFLHPLGLALGVQYDETTGTTEFAGVWDYRDDPEGMAFGDFTAEDVARAAYIDAQMVARHPARTAALGWWVQPVAIMPAPPAEPD